MFAKCQHIPRSTLIDEHFLFFSSIFFSSSKKIEFEAQLSVHMTISQASPRASNHICSTIAGCNLINLSFYMLKQRDIWDFTSILFCHLLCVCFYVKILVNVHWYGNHCENVQNRAIELICISLDGKEQSQQSKTETKIRIQNRESVQISKTMDMRNSVESRTANANIKIPAFFFMTHNILLCMRFVSVGSFPLN